MVRCVCVGSLDVNSLVYIMCVVVGLLLMLL